MRKSKKVLYRARFVSPAVKLTDKQATRIAIELDSLGNFTGTFHELPARMIVEAARNPSSAMHAVIWGKTDEELAYEARCQLARQLVNSIVRVVIEDGVEHTTQLAVHVRMSPEAQKGYVPVEEAVNSLFMSEQIYKRAISRLSGWLGEFRAFRHGEPLKSIWDTVNALVPPEERTTQPARHKKRGRKRHS